MDQPLHSKSAKACEISIPNNLLKTDCQRGAILLQVRYSVYGGLVRCGGRVVSHLAGRYVSGENLNMREYMGLGELLDRIRELYISSFISKVEELGATSKVIVEPAYRNSEGKIVTEGKLNVGSRVDVALVKESTESLNFDFDSMLSFEPICFKWSNSLLVNLAPFQWDYFSVSFPDKAEDFSPLKNWYDKWFKENPAEGSLLYDCVHFISEPEIINEMTKFHLDLGSASVTCFEELLDAMALMTSEVHIGS